MTITVSVSIDVPDLAKGVAFHCAAFCSDPFGHGFCLLQRARNH
jgi:hypothetical protein